MNCVVTIAEFSKNRDSHVFEQTGVLTLEIRRIRGFDREDLARPVHFRERQSGGLLFNVCWRWRGCLFAVADSLPAALQVHASRQAGQQQRNSRGPARIPRRFASSHRCKLSKILRSCIEGGEKREIA